MLSFRLLITPTAAQTRMSVYTYLDQIAGGPTSKIIYNGLNAAISAAMITVSATAFRIFFSFDLDPPNGQKQQRISR